MSDRVIFSLGMGNVRPRRYRLRAGNNVGPRSGHRTRLGAILRAIWLRAQGYSHVIVTDSKDHWEAP